MLWMEEMISGLSIEEFLCDRKPAPLRGPLDRDDGGG